MADITPITRDEFYLAKAGGQDVPVPSAVTREEYYLEKLSNDNVDVPTPVTRREKFLYFACGGEIELPSEERMTRLERLIAKAGGMDVSTPTAVTRLEKFWANVEAGGWKTITGVLPLTFTAKGGTAADWEISGNNNVGKNLLPSAVNGTYTNGRGTVTCNNGVYTFKISAGTGTVSITVPIPEFTIPVSVGQGGNGVLYFLNDKATSEIAIPFMYNGSSVMSNYTPLTVNRVINDYGTTETKQCNSIQFFAANSVGDYEITISPMFITDGIAPDHYIPYQQGVGERTKNLLEIGVASGTINNVTFTVDKNSGTIVAKSSGATSATTTISWQEKFSAGTYIFSAQINGANDTYRMDVSKTDWTFVAVNYTGENTFTLAEDTLLRFRVVIFSDYIADNIVFKPMLRLYDTTAEFIPYGYEVPLTISQAGQPDKTVDIYIGDSKLLSGDYVDYESGKIYKAKRIHEDTVTIDGIEWDILDYDNDEVYKADGTRAKHTVTIQTHDVLNILQYCERQALFYAESAMPAGTYHFTLREQPWYAADVNKTFKFTLTQALAAGSQICITNAYNAAMTSGKIKTYSGSTSTTAIETVDITEGSDGTDLGDVRNALVGQNTNSIQRALLGSNNWTNSAMRQWLNSSAATGSVWTPKTKFDRPPSWVSSIAGFLNGMDEDFVKAVGTVKKTTALNTVTDGGSKVESDERFFLLSRSEVYGGNEVAGGEGAAYSYYADYSDLSGAGTGADTNRIKYRNNAAQYWWLRSPYVANANGMRGVNTSGGVYTDSASNSRGVAPACCIVLDDMDDWVKQTFYAENVADLPAIETFNGENVLDTTLYNKPEMEIKYK